MGESDPGPHTCQKGTPELYSQVHKVSFFAYLIPGQLGTHNLTKTFLLVVFDYLKSYAIWQVLLL